MGTTRAMRGRLSRGPETTPGSQGPRSGDRCLWAIIRLVAMRTFACVIAALAIGCRSDAPSVKPVVRARQTLRVAVVGGMTDTGFWPAIAERYERASGDKIDVVITGPKPRVVQAFREG